ncbi:hypothetical protein PF005_g13940 [Phytophthora fragariae]|uniref:FH2 domain-containing protein n=1 Tax=Phytophthora fragariae TaxID=53985 RepID=A0A6A3YQQ6_9STRA|nr:hypothetical protein PF011_g12791 [Phytophthora fragariae]KAE9204050.1 hypothetical protein PF005_g13940 [Phytophthora fragariae]KAE9221857.1 hypothetical protein PF002_g15443 [Phytophthora fragariae]
MVKRFFKLKEFIDPSNEEFAALMQTPLEQMQHESAMEGLRECESVSKKLQEEEAPQAPIVKSPKLKKACVEVLVGKRLSGSSKLAL